MTGTVVEGNGQTQKMFGTNELNHSSVEGGAEGKEGMWADSGLQLRNWPRIASQA